MRACTLLASTAAAIGSVLDMLKRRFAGRSRQGHAQLVELVHCLRKDLDAVVAGLSLCSKGPIEGVNTKIKLLQRQVYGRAGLALLRRRILLS